MLKNSPEVLVKIPQTPGFYVYMICCRNNTLYTGWTTDMKRRFHMHAIGKGAKYTRANRPLELVYIERHHTKIQAMQREHEIKLYTREQKIKLKASIMALNQK